MLPLNILHMRVQRWVSGTTPASIICAHSPLNESQEGISHIIELKEDDPAVLCEVLKACYTCTYDDTVSGCNVLDFNAQVYALADKYGVPFLKELSKGVFQAKLTGPVDIPQLLKAVRTIYTTTLGSDRGLRDLVVPVLKTHRNTLHKDDGFRDLIKSGLGDGDFAVDMIAALSQLLDPKPEIVYFCNSCSRHNPPSSRWIMCSRSGCTTDMGKAQQP